MSAYLTSTTVAENAKLGAPLPTVSAELTHDRGPFWMAGGEPSGASLGMTSARTAEVAEPARNEERHRLTRMAFTLHKADGEEEVFADGASWRIESHGLLVITKSERTKLIYSPAGWRLIEQDERGATGSPVG